MAAKFAPPPMYEPVIIPAICANSGICLFKSKKPKVDPSIVPMELTKNNTNIFPLSFHIFVMLH